MWIERLSLYRQVSRHLPLRNGNDLCPILLRDQNQWVKISINLVSPSRSRALTELEFRLGDDSLYSRSK